MPAIQQQRTNIKNAGGSTRKIIGKFNPLILGEVHTAGNTGRKTKMRGGPEAWQELLRLQEPREQADPALCGGGCGRARQPPIGPASAPDNTSQDVFGDSAYRSAATEARLKAQGFRSRIHVRATRDHPLSKAKAAANRAKSRIRARIEHVFGAQETAPGGRVVRTIGIVRARLKVGLQNFVYNIRRLATLEPMGAA